MSAKQTEPGRALYEAMLKLYNNQLAGEETLRAGLYEALTEYEWATLSNSIQRSPAREAHERLLKQLAEAVPPPSSA